jgi:calmodulin
MNDDRLAELREEFDHFDADSNGIIDFAEFGRLLEALSAEMSQEEVRVGFEAIDLDHNGRIDFDEFRAWWEDR